LLRPGGRSIDHAGFFGFDGLEVWRVITNDSRAGACSSFFSFVLTLFQPPTNMSLLENFIADSVVSDPAEVVSKLEAQGLRALSDLVAIGDSSILIDTLVRCGINVGDSGKITAWTQKKGLKIAARPSDLVVRAASCSQPFSSLLHSQCFMFRETRRSSTSTKSQRRWDVRFVIFFSCASLLSPSPSTVEFIIITNS
jgi:hypothetical protein